MSADAFDQEAEGKKEAELQKAVQAIQSNPFMVRLLDDILKTDPRPMRWELVMKFPYERVPGALQFMRSKGLLVGWGAKDEPLEVTELGYMAHELLFKKDEDHAAS